MVLNDLGIIKTGEVGKQKDDLTNILEPKTFLLGTCVVYWNTDDEGETYFIADRKVKINHVKESKGDETPIIDTIFTVCSINLPVDPSPQNINNKPNNVTSN